MKINVFCWWHMCTAVPILSFCLLTHGFHFFCVFFVNKQVCVFIVTDRVRESWNGEDFFFLNLSSTDVIQFWEKICIFPMIFFLASNSLLLITNFWGISPRTYHITTILRYSRNACIKLKAENVKQHKLPIYFVKNSTAFLCHWNLFTKIMELAVEGTVFLFWQLQMTAIHWGTQILPHVEVSE